MPDLPLFSPPWWGIALYVLGIGFAVTFSVTLYLHRSMTHGGVVFHPLVAVPMRAVLWLVTGMKTKEWVAVHRKHHAFSDREGDPHSPMMEGLTEILLGNVIYYRRAAKDTAMMEKYGKGTPDDWLERHVFTPHGFGFGIMLVLNVLLFGWVAGPLAWLAMMIWIPLFGGVINGIGHAVGYRSFNVKDLSRNILPLAVLAGGEELHNNHHADPRSAKFSARWYEVDVGWGVIRVLEALRLARVEYARTMSVEEFNARHYKVATIAPGSQMFGPAAELDEELVGAGANGD